MSLEEPMLKHINGNLIATKPTNFANQSYQYPNHNSSTDPRGKVSPQVKTTIHWKAQYTMSTTMTAQRHVKLTYELHHNIIEVPPQ